MEAKFEEEKRALTMQYERMRRSVEESEQQKFDYEIEKFRREQVKNLESRKVDIDKLKNEKRRI
jgi:hypothetical protein